MKNEVDRKGKNDKIHSTTYQIGNPDRKIILTEIMTPQNGANQKEQLKEKVHKINCAASIA